MHNIIFIKPDLMDVLKKKRLNILHKQKQEFKEFNNRKSLRFT